MDFFLGYVIEKRSSKSTKWTKVVTLDTYCLHYCIDNLKEKSELTIRVLAENIIGLSAPAVTESIVLKTHASTYIFYKFYFIKFKHLRFFFSCSIATYWSIGNSFNWIK